MTSDDFVKIFYSNFSPNIDWANIGEISWMYQEGFFMIDEHMIASQDKFIKRIDFVLDPKSGFTINGENYGHLALKSFAKDYLVRYCGVPEKEVRYEHPLISFEVDVVVYLKL